MCKVDGIKTTHKINEIKTNYCDGNGSLQLVNELATVCAVMINDEITGGVFMSRNCKDSNINIKIANGIGSIVLNDYQMNLLVQ